MRQRVLGGQVLGGGGGIIAFAYHGASRPEKERQFSPQSRSLRLALGVDSKRMTMLRAIPRFRTLKGFAFPPG